MWKVVDVLTKQNIGIVTMETILKATDKPTRTVAIRNAIDGICVKSDNVPAQVIPWPS